MWRKEFPSSSDLVTSSFYWYPKDAAWQKLQTPTNFHWHSFSSLPTSLLFILPSFFWPFSDRPAGIWTNRDTFKCIISWPGLSDTFTDLDIGFSDWCDACDYEPWLRRSSGQKKSAARALIVHIVPAPVSSQLTGRSDDAKTCPQISFIQSHHGY